MHIGTKRFFLAAALVLGGTASQAASMLAAPNGMTLYVFDKDQGGNSACYDSCAKHWPPYLGKAGDKMTEGWTMAKRSDGQDQWLYDGKPVYFFQGDKKAGDAKGDGLGGKWHVIKE